MLIKPTAVALTLALVGLCAVAEGQQREQACCGQGMSAMQGMHGMQGMQGCGMQGLAMARVQAFSPTNLLNHKEDLTLTTDQIARLEQLDATATNARERALAGHDTHRAQLVEALNIAHPDRKVVRAHFQGAHDSMGQAHWTDINAALDAMGLLTEQQRARASGWVDMMMGKTPGSMERHGPGMGQGMSGDCPCRQ